MVTALERTADTQPISCCTPTTSARLSPEAAQQLTDDLTVLANPIRLQIRKPVPDQYNG